MSDSCASQKNSHIGEGNEFAHECRNSVKTIVENKQMSNRQVAVVRAPVKRQSKNWIPDSTGHFSADDHVNELTAEKIITKSQLKC